MKELQRALLNRLQSVYEDVKCIPDKDERKRLLKHTLEQIPEPVLGSRATNIGELLTYFMELNHYDIDEMLEFLDAEVKNSFDIATMQRERDDDFDGMYGTHTSIIMSQFELPEEISPDRLFFSARFHPSPVRTVQFALNMLARTGKRYEDFVFIDVGTGTGRNLLLASQHPFKAVIGVEISHFLCKLAEENISRYSDAADVRSPISVHCVDALQFQFPKENMVLYFWEPFREKIGDPFIGRLMKLAEAHNLHVVLIFLQSAYQRVKEDGFFTCLGEFDTPDVMDQQGHHFSISIYERKPLNNENVLEF